MILMRCRICGISSGSGLSATIKKNGVKYKDWSQSITLPFFNFNCYDLRKDKDAGYIEIFLSPHQSLSSRLISYHWFTTLIVLAINTVLSSVLLLQGYSACTYQDSMFVCNGLVDISSVLPSPREREIEREIHNGLPLTRQCHG